MTSRFIRRLETVFLTSGALFWGSANAAWSQESSFDLPVTEDTYVRRDDPNTTYGSAGALGVSGSTATNGLNIEQGIAQSWLKFDAGPAGRDFDGSFGAGAWEIVAATLTVEEVGAPRHPIFGRGVGRFEVLWVEDDGWFEGEGRPNGGGAASGNALSFNATTSRLDAQVDESLGEFSNEGVDGILTLELDLPEGFLGDLATGGEITLVFRHVDSVLGFTFHASEWIGATGQPQLTLTAGQRARDPGPVLPDEDEEVSATTPDGESPLAMCGTGLVSPSMAMLLFAGIRFRHSFLKGGSFF